MIGLAKSGALSFVLSVETESLLLTNILQHTVQFPLRVAVVLDNNYMKLSLNEYAYLIKFCGAFRGSNATWPRYGLIFDAAIT